MVNAVSRCHLAGSSPIFLTRRPIEPVASNVGQSSWWRRVTDSRALAAGSMAGRGSRPRQPEHPLACRHCHHDRAHVTPDRSQRSLGDFLAEALVTLGPVNSAGRHCMPAAPGFAWEPSFGGTVLHCCFLDHPEWVVIAVPQQIQRARAEGRMLGQLRDLLIMRKPRELRNL